MRMYVMMATESTSLHFGDTIDAVAALTVVL
jgi:hypothetical protein